MCWGLKHEHYQIQSAAMHWLSLWLNLMAAIHKIDLMVLRWGPMPHEAYETISRIVQKTDIAL